MLMILDIIYITKLDKMNTHYEYYPRLYRDQINTSAIDADIEDNVPIKTNMEIKSLRRPFSKYHPVNTINLTDLENKITDMNLHNK